MQKLIEFLAFHGADVGFQFTNEIAEDQATYTIQNLPPNSQSIFIVNDRSEESIFIPTDEANWKNISPSKCVSPALDGEVSSKALEANKVISGNKILTPEVKSYSSDLTLIEGLVNSKYLAKDHNWGWTIQVYRRESDVFAIGATLPHALCIAYLKMK